MENRNEKIIKYLIVAGGAIIYTTGLNLFVTPLKLYSGGVMGISQLIRTLLVDRAGLNVGSFDLSGVIYYVLNLPLLFIAYEKISKSFFGKTLMSLTLIFLSMAVIPIPKEPLIDDMLTGCAIGGLTVGTGVGLMLWAGGSGAGFDILGMFLTKKFRNFSVGKVSLACNCLIYIACGFLFNFETAVYSVILTSVSSLTIDRIHYQNIMIQAMIFTKVDNVARPIMERLHRGVTEWTGDGAYTNDSVQVLVTVVSRYETSLLRRIVMEIDPHAFITYSRIQNVDGNFEKKLS